MTQQYCWRNSQSTETRKGFFLVLQKWAMRILARLGHRESCCDAFKQLKIIAVVRLFALETPSYAKRQNLQTGNNTHRQNTRRANNIIRPTPSSFTLWKITYLYGCQISEHPTRRGDNATWEKIVGENITMWFHELPCYTMEEFENWRRVFS